MKLTHAMLTAMLAIGVSFGGLPLKVPGVSNSLYGVSEAQAQRYVRRPVRRGYRRPYRRAPARRYNSRRNVGGALAAGAIIGLAAGAIAANAARQRRPVYSRRAPAPRGYCNYRACSYRYRSFDPGSCTYQPYNGPRRYCRL